VLGVEDWVEIRRLHRSEGMPIKAIARVMGVSQNTVRAALRAEAPPRYERAGSGSIVDDVEPRIRELLLVPTRARSANRPKQYPATTPDVPTLYVRSRR
jgi:transposase